MFNNRFITSWDDGHRLDIKLSFLLKKYNIPAIFFISNNCPKVGERRMTENEIIDLSKDFEIGGHTTNHYPDLKILPEHLLFQELKENKDWLEELIGKKVTKFCYPRGRYNQQVIHQLKLLGFEEARKTCTGIIEKQENPYEIKTSVHVYPKSKRFGKPHFLKNAKELWDKSIELGDKGSFHMWGHSWEIAKYNMWDKLEKFFKYIQKDKEIFINKKI